MIPIFTYWMWNTGNIDGTLNINLDWQKSYLITGYLTLTEGDNYAHVYISTVCHYRGGDQILCGVRDAGDDFGLSVTEFVSSASRVTIKLRTRGGRHRVEGVIYEL